MVNKTFRELYNSAHEVYSKFFGYNRFSLHPEENFCTKVSPSDLSRAGYQMFLAGAKAALESKGKDDKGIEEQLGNLEEEFLKE
jgi:hypothetical protein